MSRTALLLLAVVPAVPLAAQSPQRFELTGSEAEVYNLVGGVRVESGTGTAVQVEVTTAGADAGKLQVDASGSTLRVRFPGDRIRYPRMDHSGSTTLHVDEDGTFDGHRHGGGRRVRISRDEGDLEAWADLRILVPAGRSLELHLAVGRIAASNVNGRLRLSAAAAPVTVTGGSGELSVGTGSGDVRVSGGRGEARLSTGSGDIEVTSWESGDLEAETGSGDIVAKSIAAPRLRAQTGSGDVLLSKVQASDVGIETGSGEVTLELQSIVQVLDVETGSGDVSIVAPPATSARLEIETGSGEIESDFPLEVTRSGRHHLVGTIGDGKARVSVATGSGGVRLMRAGGA
jgi:lia operon protein LiaG